MTATASGEAYTRALYDQYGPALQRHLTRLTGDRAQAEDLVQETMLRAWRNRDKVNSMCMAWLWHVGRNLAVDLFRAQKARPCMKWSSIPDEVAEDIGYTPPDETSRVNDTITVASMLAALDPIHREVLVEVYIRDHSVTQAAKALGIPSGTVKSRTSHALEELRAVAGRQGFDMSTGEAMCPTSTAG
jgi:RNA polymerase sigma-70 factor (ECF subfamily)